MVREANGPAAQIEKMIAAAEATLGLGEPNYIQSWYEDNWGDLGGNWPWCNAAVTYWAHKSGNAKAVCFGDDKGFAYTVYHAQEFKDHGQWTFGTNGIRRGDIVFFDWQGADSIAAIDHVELVTGVRPDGTVDTIGGNYQNKCGRWQRHAYEIAGYGRPAYGDGVPEPEPTPEGEGEYTVKAGDTLSSIAAALDIEGGWAALYAANKALIGPDPDAIAVGLVLAVPGGDAEPEPEPEPQPERKIVFEAVYFGAPVSDSVKIVQDALNKEFGGVVVDGDYGPQTKEAYARWQRSLGFSGSDADGNPGATSMSRLAARYGFLVTHGEGPKPGSPPADGEPAHIYTRVSYGGKTVNARTRTMLQNAVKLLTEYEWTPRLTQGSYNTGVGASAGTHDGGGVVDINVGSMSVNGMYICAQALRKAGFAAWVRTPAQGFAYHIHAVAIGDREMSSAAKSQIAQWRNDTNGLANHGPDPYADPYPAWTQKYR